MTKRTTTKPPQKSRRLRSVVGRWRIISKTWMPAHSYPVAVCPCGKEHSVMWPLGPDFNRRIECSCGRHKTIILHKANAALKL